MARVLKVEKQRAKASKVSARRERGCDGGLPHPTLALKH